MNPNQPSIKSGAPDQSGESVHHQTSWLSKLLVLPHRFNRHRVNSLIGTEPEGNQSNRGDIFYEQVIHHQRMTLQSVRPCVSNSQISVANMYRDTQIYNRTQVELSFRAGSFQTGDFFLIGSIRDLRFNHILGRRGDFEINHCGLIEFSFLAAPPRPALIHSGQAPISPLQAAVFQLRDAFARGGVESAQRFVRDLNRAYGSSASSYTENMPEVPSEYELDFAAVRREPAGLSTRVWDAMRGLVDVSIAELASVWQEAGILNESNIPQRIYRGEVFTTTPVPFSGYALVRFLTPRCRNSGVSLAAWVPAKGSKNDGDLSDISIRITGPRAWSGLSRSHIVRGASELINSPNRASSLFRALHAANVSGLKNPQKIGHVVKEVEALRK